MDVTIDMQRMIDAIPVGVHVIDPSGNIVDVNRAWQIHFGVTAANVRGRPLKEVMRSMVFFNSGAMQKDKPWEFEDPAALEVLRTRLPSTASFHMGQSQAIARPILDEKGNIRYVVTTIVERVRQRELERRSAAEKTLDTQQLLGDSRPIQLLRRLISRVAPSDATVLITGATGTGKEVIASELQRLSARWDKPFVKVNCAAIPESLMEAELFGYEKGAFTGALKTGKVGHLEAANGGTILLDEISEMPLSLQPKLLRAIQERKVVRVGGVHEIPIDVRILAATNQDLQTRVEQNLFREDLYYRLNVIRVELPLLKDRGADVLLLANFFLQEFNQKYGRCASLSPEAEDELLRYPWPGNVRELRNLCERIVVLNEDGVLRRDQLCMMLDQKPTSEAPSETPLTLQEATDRLQHDMISEALRVHRTTYRAAAALGISQSTLVRKAKALGIPTGGEI